MTLGPGKTFGLLCVLAALGTAWAATRPREPSADLVVWVFADSHAQLYRQTLVPAFEKTSGLRVRVELINARAMETRLQSILLAGQTHALPDVVELEIGSIARFFRAPPERIGLLPLESRLSSNSLERLLPARRETWSKGGHVFGVPLDVHPVALVYRKDLWDEADLDPTRCESWDDFAELARQFRGRFPNRFAIELPPASADVLVMMLLQRGVNLISASGQSALTDPRVADTVAFYARLAGGARAAGDASTPGPLNYLRDLRDGRIASILAADWRFAEIVRYAPDLLDRLAVMPLPKFDLTDAPTSTWGGTMMGIPRASKHLSNAVRLLEHLSLSEQSIEARKQLGLAIPLANAGTIARPILAVPGRDAFSFYQALANQVPQRVVTPATALAQLELARILRLAVDYADDPQLTSLVAGWLASADVSLAATIRFAQTEP